MNTLEDMEKRYVAELEKELVKRTGERDSLIRVIGRKDAALRRALDRLECNPDDHAPTIREIKEALHDP